MNETVSLDPSKPVTKEHHYILFRYAEVLLNYAEAMAEWKGESYTDDKHTMTATAALNQVRNAANMPNITTTGDAFKESVRRERRVELAFEDHRFWDIRRWKIGEQTQKIYRTRLPNNLTEALGTRKYYWKKETGRIRCTSILFHCLNKS